jgi:magnesium transporter
VHTDLSQDDIRKALQDSQGLLWVDMAGERSDDVESVLQDLFGFAPLAIDDALREDHTPKLDDWGEHILVVFNAPNLEWKGEGQARMEPLELDCFLGHNYFVTYGERAIPAVARVWETALRDERYLKHGPDHLLYRVADELASEAIESIEQMREVIDHIEEQLFDRPTPETLEQIFSLRRMVLRMRRILSPQSDVMGKLARDDFPMIDARDRAYFRDVYDHFMRLDSINENLRDLVSGALDIYLSLLNNRMNEAMRMLAVITALFMPISFLAGFFGMNFFGPAVRLEAWTGVLSLGVTLALMVILPVLMYWWMRRRGWL